MSEKKTIQPTEDVKFEKALSPLSIWGLALGAMIGWGCFVLPGNEFLPKGGPLGSTIGLIIGAMMIILISFSYSYLISKFPVAGGEFVYAYASFGKLPAFICGWFIAIAYWALIPMNGTAVGLIGRYLFPGLLQHKVLYSVAGWEVYDGEIIVSILAILIVGLINMRGVKAAGWFQTAVALGLVGAILLVTAGVMISQPSLGDLKPYYPTGSSPIKGIFAIAAMAPWAFVGFDCIPQASEEYAFSNKKTKKLLISSIAIACLMYALMNLVTGIVLPWEEFLAEGHFWPTGFAVEMVVGKVGLLFLGIAMFCGIVSGLNAFYLAGSRLLYSMSLAGALPDPFKKLDSVYKVPRMAIVFMMVLAIIAPFFGRQVLSWLVDMTSVGAAMGFAFTTASAARFAWKHENRSQMVISLIGLAFAVFFLSLLLLPFTPGTLSLEAWICLIIWLVIGAVFYFIKREDYRQSDQLEESIRDLSDESEHDHLVF
ncbi:MAG: APC family permease [Clostridiales bacterium]|nr:APC family permease [Clostridiales bacterium]